MEEAMTHQTNNQNNQNQGPLKLRDVPQPPTREASRALESLRRGHSTSDLWLPEGLWPELDAIRAEQIRVRSQAAAELSALAALDERFGAEDRDHADKLRQAQRDGDSGAIDDRRTPPGQRQAERRAIEESLWAALEILAQIADAVPELASQHEDEWLADLRTRLVPKEEKVRELQQRLADAEAEAFNVHKLGLWLQQLSDDGAFGRQPYPTPEPPPKRFNPEMLERSLERPWHRRPDAAEEPPVAWQDQPQPPARNDADDPVGDATGEISELVETGEGASS
jgi:hypothetical protein